MHGDSREFTYSDHLSVEAGYVFAQLDVRVASWNVLFDKWLKMNIGPAGDGHIGKFFPHLTKMDPNTRKLGIMLTITDLLRRVDILALQEFDPAYLADLNTVLTHIRMQGNGDFVVILPSDLKEYDKLAEAPLLAKGSNDLQIVIYNRRITHNVQRSHMSYYVAKDGTKKIAKRIMNISFSMDGREFRFVNTHVLFEAMNQLVACVDAIRRPVEQEAPMLIIVVGDMNQTDLPASLSEGSDENVVTHLGTYRDGIGFIRKPYTHIDTHGKAVVYDHIWHKII